MLVVTRKCSGFTSTPVWGFSPWRHIRGQIWIDTGPWVRNTKSNMHMSIPFKGCRFITKFVIVVANQDDIHPLHERGMCMQSLFKYLTLTRKMKTIYPMATMGLCCARWIWLDLNAVTVLIELIICIACLHR